MHRAEEGVLVVSQVKEVIKRESKIYEGSLECEEGRTQDHGEGEAEIEHAVVILSSPGKGGRREQNC